jgi:lysyl-tRNA synthetase class 1
MSANGLPIPQIPLAAAEACTTWDFEEARKIVRRHAKTGFPSVVLFETGYGPSGLPHIGTFGEVARTTMVRQAFRVLTQDTVATKLLCFSDDMDGMRKVPDNVPNREMLQANLGRPLTRVPDPFGKFESFGHHNNARLRSFLDRFGFDYEFASATEYYASGRFDAMLMRAAERYDDIMAVMLPTLGEERQATYSCFLPVSPSSGRILYVPMKEVDARKGTITFADEDGRDATVPVTGGHVKLQWKPDFGMRWAALGVDFEMFGKDHQTNAAIYDRICAVLGGRPPEHFVYELFLDEHGQKISKSKGNGLTIEEWLTYASPESLSYFMFQKPRTAKRLYFDVIPRCVDEYHQHLAAYAAQSDTDRLQNPVWHIHNGAPPTIDMPVTFAMLLNLVSASNAHDKDILWGFITAYRPDVTARSHPELDRLAGFAIRYFDDFVAPTKKFRAPDAGETAALRDLDGRLAALGESADGEAIQGEVFACGKKAGYQNLRDWFQALYQTLLGQDQGPRFGSFVALYGIARTRKLIERALAGELAAQTQG